MCTNDTDRGPFGVEVRLNTVFETPVESRNVDTVSHGPERSRSVTFQIDLIFEFTPHILVDPTDRL